MKTWALLIAVTALSFGTAFGDDRDVLTTLYEALGGDNWERSDGWMSDQPVGNWHGVTVRNGRVVEIALSDNDLTGALPWQLGNLTNLKRLDLRWNAIAGPIPESLSELHQLEGLLLTGNALRGEIPWSFSRLDSLKRLDLSHNQLTGSIPKELAELPSLRALGLHQNRLTGSIPWELSRIETLQRLIVNGNYLTGPVPPELHEMQGLAHLNIEDNPLGWPSDAPIPKRSKHIDGMDALDESTRIIDNPQARVFIRKLMGAISVRDGFLHLDAETLPAGAGPVEIKNQLDDINQRLRDAGETIESANDLERVLELHGRAAVVAPEAASLGSRSYTAGAVGQTQ